ncbi:Gfo/Idh/MocA family protein [Amycolatopsis sp. NPDC059657]|uniref:Gfo/Idh/MocA family protein n=1 Tax=Amycolatopsis sp. NPDC059657 TaxID=3346899 RepID=UPI00366BC50B
MKPFRFGIVGHGWRADFYLRIAHALPERFTVVGVVTRTAERGAEVEQAWGVPTYRDIDGLLTRNPDFVVTSVPREANPSVVTELVRHGLPVLSETPPARDRDELRKLWAEVGASGLVQVAEQYPFQPMHAVRESLARKGILGTVTGAQVSSTHDYHAVALIRGLLGAGFAPATVSARRFAAPLVKGPDRAGRPDHEVMTTAHRVVATLDFGDGRVGLYDFTDGQWWHPLRTHRHVVSGSHGEIVDDVVHRMAASSRIERRQTGMDSNLEGHALDSLTLDGEVCWHNPYFPARLSDEEIAIASMLEQIGNQPYPLAEACQDHLIALAIKESWETGRPVTTTREAWATEPRAATSDSGPLRDH